VAYHDAKSCNPYTREVRLEGLRNVGAKISREEVKSVWEESGSRER
jgi:hypothetical protein